MKNNDNDIEQLQNNINEITEHLKALFIQQEKLYKAIKKENNKKRKKLMKYIERERIFTQTLPVNALTVYFAVLIE